MKEWKRAAVLVGSLVLGIALLLAAIIADALGAEVAAKVLYGFGFVVYSIVFGLVLAPWWPLALVIGPLVLAAAIIAEFRGFNVLANVLFGYSFVIFSVFSVHFVAHLLRHK